MLKFDKFSWAEALSNSQGKSSIALLSGFIIILTGCVGFTISGTILLILAIIKYDVPGDIQTLIFQSVIVITLGAGLFGIRRFTADKEIKNA